MNYFSRVRTIVTIAFLILCTACLPKRDRTPSIIVDSMHTQSGLALRVMGRNWQPGSEVMIGFNTPDGQPKDSETIATALTDASGSFVALFLFPMEKQWAQMSEIRVVAYTHDFNQVATASFYNPQLFTPTPVPQSTPRVTLTIQPIVYVLGYVKNTSPASRSLALKPLEGQAETITWDEHTQVLYAGQPMQPSEIQVGDLIEASGQSITKDHVMAHQILILARAIIEQTPTPTKPLSAWRGEYYNNTTFSGVPIVTRSDPIIDFQWQNGSPIEGLPADHFAVRWTGNWPFETGTYRFYAQVDDGVRLWLDEHLMIDRWHESTGALYSADAYVSDGFHAIRVEYFEAWANAHARVWWEYRSRDIAVVHPDWKAE
ncbi:MAG: PA14 domain-containing protein [Candidatus Hadarchaeum sp.]